MRELKGDWRDLFHCFRMALDLRKLSLAFVGMAFSIAGIALILTATLLSSQYLTAKWWEESGRPLKESQRTRLLKDMRAGHWTDVRKRLGIFAADLCETSCVRAQAGAPSGERLCCACLRQAWCRCPLAHCRVPSKAGMVLWTVSGAWLLAVWSFFGGAITRIAAVELARDERIEFNEAARFASARYGSYLWSPLSVVVAALVFALFILGACWICDATWTWGIGKLLMLLVLPLALLGSFLIALLAIGGLLGGPLMFPAISAEGTDAFDAVSRAFSYVFSRPWRYLAYHLVAFLYAIPSCLFVLLFTGAFLKLALRLCQLGMPHAADRFGLVVAAQSPALGGSFSWAPFSQGPLLWVTTCLVFAMIFILAGLSWAYPVSYLFSARTIIYFLMRKAVDGTEMREVYEEESEEELVAGSASPPPAGEPPKA